MIDTVIDSVGLSLTGFCRRAAVEKGKTQQGTPGSKRIIIISFYYSYNSYYGFIIIRFVP